MGYANPIERWAWKSSWRRRRPRGVDGVIVVDYPLEDEQFAAMAKKPRSIRFFCSRRPRPTSASSRSAGSAAAICTTSRRGITGASNIDLGDVALKIPKIRARDAPTPIGVGFGIRDAASAKRVAQSADAVVIGSRIIEIEAGPPIRR